MAGSAADNFDEEKPLDPMVENVRRKMMRLMIISIGIMMIGLMAVLGAIVYKYNTGGEKTTVSESVPVRSVSIGNAVLKRGNILLPNGAVIETSSLAGDQILLKVRFSDGSLHLMVFDMTTVSIVADFSVVTNN